MGGGRGERCGAQAPHMKRLLKASRGLEPLNNNVQLFPQVGVAGGRFFQSGISVVRNVNGDRKP